jgi:hypothetical protein
MSSCIVTGFFNVGLRRRGLRRVPVGAIQPETILFAHYRSSLSLSGTMHSLGTVFIRPPTATWHNILTDRAVVFVAGTIFAQTGSRLSLIEATHMSVIHGPQSDHVCRIVFPPCLVTAVGTVASQHYYITPNFLAVPITISQEVWDVVRTFSLTCVLSCLLCFSCVLIQTSVA